MKREAEQAGQGLAQRYGHSLASWNCCHQGKRKMCLRSQEGRVKDHAEGEGGERTIVCVQPTEAAVKKANYHQQPGKWCEGGTIIRWLLRTRS